MIEVRPTFSGPDLCQITVQGEIVLDMISGRDIKILMMCKQILFDIKVKVKINYDAMRCMNHKKSSSCHHHSKPRVLEVYRLIYVCNCLHIAFHIMVSYEYLSVKDVFTTLVVIRRYIL